MEEGAQAVGEIKVEAKPENVDSVTGQPGASEKPTAGPAPLPQTTENFWVGYNECMEETLHYLVHKEQVQSINSYLCLRLVNHLKKHYHAISGANRDQDHAGDSTGKEIKLENILILFNLYFL